MKHPKPTPKSQAASMPATDAPATLLSSLRDLIQRSRQQALRAVDTVQVQTCWEIGRHIFEFEQSGKTRAAYGQKLVPRLAEALTREFGRGFDERNLRHMRSLYLGFPIWNAVRTKLSRTHYRQLVRVESTEARRWFIGEAAAQGWSSRADHGGQGTKNQAVPITSQVASAQGSETCVAYRKTLLQRLVKARTRVFRCGSDVLKPHNVQAFHQVPPICDALRRKLNRMHYLQLLRMCSSGLHH